MHAGALSEGSTDSPVVAIRKALAHAVISIDLDLCPAHSSVRQYGDNSEQDMLESLQQFSGRRCERMCDSDQRSLSFASESGR
jgi:hypothetical protein